MASRSQRDAVLVLEADRRAVGVGAGRPAGVGEQQQGEQAVRLGRVGQQLDDEAGEADRLLAEVGPHQLVAGGGDVALGVDEVQHVQHAAEPLGQLVVGGHPVGDAGRLHLALGPHEPLVHRRLGGQERPGDLGHLEAADGPEGERHPGLEGEGGVAAGEEQAEPVVGDAAAVVAVVVGRRGVVVVAHECFEVLEGGLVGGAGAAAAEGVDRPPPGDGGQPAAGPGGDAASSATPPRRRRRRRRRPPRPGRRRRPPGRRASRGARSTPRGTPARWPGGRRRRPPVRPTAQASCSWLDSGRTSTEP